MAITAKSIEFNPIKVPASADNKAKTAEIVRGLDPRMQQAKKHIDLGEYQLALERIAINTSDAELLNCRAVCFMRLNRFHEAIQVLRRVALNTGTFQIRQEVAAHIKINYAIALFYGGEAAGGIGALGEIQLENDPAVKMLRAQARKWVAGMSFLSRLDWHIDRIAPKTRPALPQEPLGQFVWDIS